MTKEKAKQIISAHGLGYTIKEWDEAIAVIFNDEPSLPADINGAAGEYSKNFSPYFSGFVKEIFGAGAKWAVRQGTVIETSMLEDDTGDLVPVIADMRTKGFKYGERVIVQIRKI